MIQRQIIFDAFRGHCVSLLRLSSAAQVLESAYNDYANAQQRYNIIVEFYGVDFAYFKVIGFYLLFFSFLSMNYSNKSHFTMET